MIEGKYNIERSKKLVLVFISNELTSAIYRDTGDATQRQMMGYQRQVENIIILIICITFVVKLFKRHISHQTEHLQLIF